MNLIRQREKLKELHRLGILETSHLNAALRSPVFEWTPADKGRKLMPDEQQFVAQHIQTSDSNVPTCAPFDCFRMVDKSGFLQWFRWKETRQWFLVSVGYDDETGPEQWYLNIYGWDAGARCEYRGWQSGKEITHLMSKAGKPIPEVAGAMRNFITILSYFLFELMMPGNTVLKVEPGKDSAARSVEWRLARTHYCIINRKQAEQCRERKQGPTAQQLVRAAHWRRAHFRRLVSERYTEGKRNTLIPVRQAWVGPAEWTGLDGKIYKVINL